MLVQDLQSSPLLDGLVGVVRKFVMDQVRCIIFYKYAFKVVIVDFYRLGNMCC